MFQPRFNLNKIKDIVVKVIEIAKFAKVLGHVHLS